MFPCKSRALWFVLSLGRRRQRAAQRGTGMAARLARAHDFVPPSPGSINLLDKDALRGVLCTPNASLIQTSDGRFMQAVGIHAARAKPLQVELTSKPGVRARAADRIANPFSHKERGDIEGSAFEWIILGFYGGVFTNGKKQVRVLETESNDAGVRRVRFEETGGAPTGRPKRSTSTIIQFLKEFPPQALDMAAQESQLVVQAPGASFDVGSLTKLCEAARLVGVMAATESFMPQTEFVEFLRAASAEGCEGRVEASSVSVKLDKQLKLSAAAKRELDMALSLCGETNLSLRERGRLLRAHCVAPNASTGAMQPAGPGRESVDTSDSRADEDDDASSDSASDDDTDERESSRESDQDARKRARQASPPPETEGESRADEEVQVVRAKRVKMSPSTEVELLIPRNVSQGDFISVLFKPKRIAETAGFEDAEDAESPDAKRARVMRAGLALRRLKETCGPLWPETGRLRDLGAVYEWRERVVDAVARVHRCAERQLGAQQMRTQSRSPPGTRVVEQTRPPSMTLGGRELATAAGESERGRVLSSGAAPLAVEVQPGAVSADVAERLHEAARAGQLQFSLGGDVGAGMRIVPEHLREDLARAVGSNGRVDAAGECLADRASLPGPVRCMCSTLVSQVQRALRDLPAGDEAGLRSVSSEVTRKLAAAAVVGRFRVREYIRESRSILEAAAPTANSLEELQEAWAMMRVALQAVRAAIFDVRRWMRPSCGSTAGCA
ncbi:MAG: hypothetical protein SGPRY_012138 [Prymnesium sp.]